MSNVIDLLERMGQDARLRHASQDEVELALTGAQIDPELRAAILAKDQRWLELLLGASNACCYQAAEEEEEKEDKDDDTDTDTEESSSRDGERMRSQSAFRLAASAR